MFIQQILCVLLPLYLYAHKADILLLHTYTMSEKLDGIRVYWDGKQLLSRNGKVIHALATSKEKLMK